MEKFNKLKTSYLAILLGMSTSYVSQIKSGKRPLSPKSAQIVHKECNIPLWDLRPDVYPKSLFNK